MLKYYALILAGGTGSRMQNTKLLKPFLPLSSQTIIEKTLSSFKKSMVEKALIIIPENDFNEYSEKIKNYGLSDFVQIITGGKTRQESAYNGLKQIKQSKGAEIVVIHDAVRPFISSTLINQTIEAAIKHKAAEVAVPVIDTLVQTDGNFAKSIPDRSFFYNVQTPQTFNFDLIFKAYQQAIKDNFVSATDDVQLIVRLGYKVKIIEGSYNNIKITTPTDYQLAKIIDQTFLE